MVERRIKLVTAAAILVLLAAPIYVCAQGRGARGGPPQTAKQAAPIDLTGYWVSLITEDWRWRMLTPPKGSYPSVPLNAEGKRIANAWDPAKDEAAGDQCKAYGAANIMRLPGRLHITWENDNTLRIDTDTGNQTRRFHFDAAQPGEPSLLGHSQATWQFGPGERGAARTGNLKVVTTNLRAGYIRKNGAPHSDKAVITEYIDLNTTPNGDQWMTITTRIDDPVYFSRPLINTTDFKKLPNANGWNPTPCSVK
jgi:hypothetical protein